MIENRYTLELGEGAARVGRVVNVRRGKNARAQRLASRTSQAVLRDGSDGVRGHGWSICLGILLMLPICLVTTQALRVMVGQAWATSFWRAPSGWFFGMGIVMWLLAFAFLRRPVAFYVWGHEMTHALAVLICGGAIKEFRVTAKGGHILTDRNNVFIALAPYFVPLYSVMIVLAFLVAGLFCDLTLRLPLPWGGGIRPLYLLFFLMGVSWAFHLSFTVWMIGKDQPDLKLNGTFFSLTLIYLVNLLSLAALLILAAPGTTLGEFTRAWMASAQEYATLFSDALRHAAQ
jgi:hypothetical protein